MTSKFSELPNNLIIKIIQIENDRRKYEKERMKKKYNEVIHDLNKLKHCDFLGPSVRDIVARGCLVRDIAKFCADPDIP